jgi:hypothetical protein
MILAKNTEVGAVPRGNTVKGTPLLPWPANCRRDCWPWRVVSSTNKEMDYLVISEEQRKKITGYNQTISTFYAY